MKALALALAFLPSLVFADFQFKNELEAIEYIESSGGRFVNHKLILSGMHKGTRAGGRFGIMPITAKEIVAKCPRLMSKYSFLMEYSHDQVTEFLNKNPKADKDLATSFWKTLRKKYGPRRSAFSWYHGPGAAAKASPEAVLNSAYVQKFQSYMKNNFMYQFAVNP